MPRHAFARSRDGQHDARLRGTPVTHAIRLVPSTLFAAIILAAPVFAQAPTPPKAKAPGPAPVAAKPAPTAVAAKPAPTHRALVSTSPNPTVDEGTVQRISQAMLSYSVLEVQGGWPTLPASAAKLAPGAKGPDVP